MQQGLIAYFNLSWFVILTYSIFICAFVLSYITTEVITLMTMMMMAMMNLASIPESL